jgi:transposase-like protein
VSRNDTSTPAPAVTWECIEAFARGKVQQFVQHVLEEEVTALLGRGRSERRAAVDAPTGYRNGPGEPRRLAMQSGTITLRRPRLRGLEARFESKILPLFARRTKELGELLPELYLHGLSLGDFELALRGLLGEGAPLSASSIARLKAGWQIDYDAWKARDLSDREVVYAWADGVYVKAGLEKEKACLLVVIGAFRDGHKEILALASGYRESTESWLAVLRDLRARGLGAPVLAVADGAMAFWAAAAMVWPETRVQRCWNHGIVNVLDRLPKSQQRAAQLLLCAMPYASTRAEAARLRDGFARRYRASCPEAVRVLEKDWETLTTFYDFPAEHWKHLRTSNVVESPFATLRLRTGAARRFKVVANATMLIWRVLRVVEHRFRKLDAPELLKDVYEGRRFENGKPTTRAIRKEAA